MLTSIVHHVDPTLINIVDALAFLQEPQHFQCILLALDEAPLGVGLDLPSLEASISQTEITPQYLLHLVDFELYLVLFDEGVGNAL